MTWKLQNLPYDYELETKTVLKQLTSAHRALAELKGVAQSIPRQDILINALSYQEAKDSSEVENIVTTHDELYKGSLGLEKFVSPNAKEVQNYAAALKRGFDLVNENGHLTNRYILTIQSILEQNSAGFRKVPGTTLKNQQTGEVIYQPPQDHKIIVSLMENLELFI